MPLHFRNASAASDLNKEAHKRKFAKENSLRQIEPWNIHVIQS
jgi:hypothetical protein